MYSKYNQFEKMSRNQDQFVQMNNCSKFKKKEYYIVIDSSNRDRSIDSSSSSFIVKMDPENDFNGCTLPRKYKNVQSIELISATYPNTNNVTDEMYLILNIDEFSTNHIEKTNNINGFVLTPKQVLTNYVHYYANETYPSKMIFDTKGKTIEKMTIKVLKNDGTLFSFGVDNVLPNAVNPLLQCSFKFKITTLEPDVF